MGSKVPQPSPNSPPPISSTDNGKVEGGKVEGGYTGPYLPHRLRLRKNRY